MTGIGDLNGDGVFDFIVGAPGTNGYTAGYAGSVFVYSGATGTLLYEKDGPEPDGFFGYSLAVTGDMDGDNVDDFIVGAPYTDPGGILDAGSAFVFSGATGGLLYRINGDTVGARLGFSVAGLSDIDGDSRADFLVSAPAASRPNDLLNCGVVLVYSGATGNFLYELHGTYSSWFGYATAGLDDLSGDGKPDFVVLAPYGFNYFKVFVYSGPDGLLVRQLGNVPAGVVSKAGDLNGDSRCDFIVSDPYAYANGSYGTGEAKVISGRDGATLFTKGGVFNGNFGRSVGEAGDVNGDGTPDFIVGAGLAGPAGGSAVYVYSGIDGSLLFWQLGAPGDGFGSSVSGAGDLDGDARSEIIVGAPGFPEDTLQHLGSAFVYRVPLNENAPSWETANLNQSITVGFSADFIVSAADPDGTIPFLQAETLPAGAVFLDSLNGRGRFSWTPSLSQTGIAPIRLIAWDGVFADTQEIIFTVTADTLPDVVLLASKVGFYYSDAFGAAVAGIGDIDADGRADFLIGAPFVDSGGIQNIGSVYAYSGATGALIYKKNGSLSLDRLGNAVAGTGDVNGDGASDFIIGSPHIDPYAYGPPAVGSAFVYDGATGALLYQKTGGSYPEYFGYSVAGAGDVDGDGKADFIVGAPGCDCFLPQSSGAVYVYSGSTGDLIFQKNGTFYLDHFGETVAGVGDADGDGRGDFAVGAPGAPVGSQGGVGSVFVYSGATGTLLVKKDGDERYFAKFGASISTVGDINGDGKSDFIVGAPGNDAGGLRLAGSAYVYSGADGRLLYEKRGSTQFGEFGFSVAGQVDFDGDGRDDFIVGAPNTDQGGKPLAGAAYVYSGSTGALLFQTNGTLNYANLGYSVAGAGDINGDGKADFLAGAPSSDPRSSPAVPGSAFVFGRTGCAASKGDLDYDCTLSLTDVVLLLNCVFLGTENCPFNRTDMNCDSRLSPADMVLMLNAVFAAVPLPC